MKKYLPYILLLILVGGFAGLIISNSGGGPRNKRKPRLDQYLYLDRAVKKPYGLYVAFQSLQKFFPETRIVTGLKSEHYLDTLNTYLPGRAWMVVTNEFNPSEEEMKTLLQFVSNGNTLFISARSLSYVAQKQLHTSINETAFWYFEDSLKLQLNHPPFNGPLEYSYPGKKFASTFSNYQERFTEVLAEEKSGNPVFLRCFAGSGTIYIHLAPLSFSNYFLMHQHNLDYFGKILSVIPDKTGTIYWDEYFVRKRRDRENLDENKDSRNWWTVMNEIESMRAALWTAIIGLLVYILLEMRRRRSAMPKMERPRNDSLDFVKTVGRLYLERRNHRDLCAKMSTYFLEHIRNRYRLSTNKLDEEFVRQLHMKSGYPEKDLQRIITFINYIERGEAVSEYQLAGFYSQLESFYQST